jgi:hypothetical protein
LKADLQHDDVAGGPAGKQRPARAQFFSGPASMVRISGGPAVEPPRRLARNSERSPRYDRESVRMC